jgi:PAN domain
VQAITKHAITDILKMLPILFVLAGIADAGPSLEAYDNYDLSGPTIKTSQNVDLQGCAAICQSDSQCQAFSYNKWTRQCSLKQSVGSFRLDRRVASGIPANAPPPLMSSDPVVMECFKEAAFGPEAYKAVATSTFETCQKQCESDKDCIAFTYFESQRACHFFQTTNRSFAERAAISGVKGQFESGNATCSSFATDNKQTEQDVYKAARGDKVKLENEAHEEIRQIDARQQDQFERNNYQDARGDVSKLRHYLLTCSICSKCQ